MNNNIFGTANLAVRQHKYMTSTASSTPEVSMMAVYENAMHSLEADRNAKKLHEDEQRQKALENATLMSAATSFDSYLTNLSTKLYMEGKEMLFKDIMTSIYLESVYLDDDFKQENANNIKQVMADYIEKNGGYVILEAACRKQRTNKLLNKMKDTIDSTARKASLRKVNSLKEACAGKNKGAKALEVMNQKQIFDLNSEEVKEYHQSREKLSEDEIVNLVKDKVLTVVKDESQRQRDIEAFEQEVQDTADSLQTEKEKEAFKESMTSFISNGAFVDSTLFESINISTMTEMVEEMKAQEVEENSIDMDLVMAESITKYTLLEVMHTMCLESFTTADVQRLCMQLRGK